MNYRVPIIIISYNRFLYLKELVEYFLSIGEDCIYVLDNASTYQPLLDWFSTVEKNGSVKIFRLNKNYGHRVYWDISFYKNISDCKYCVITDNDIIPYKKFENGWKEKWINTLEKYNIKKVGSAISIDDIPDIYPLKKDVISHENKFWKKEIKIDEKNFYANIDTTLYLQKVETKHTHSSSIRMTDYLIKHRPWYLNISDLCEEDLYYYSTIAKESTHWSGRFKNFMRKVN